MHILALSIREGDLTSAIQLMRQIPEMDTVLPVEAYAKKIEGKPQLILIAQLGEKEVGFKIGYQREDFFYSWLGGVLPEFRQMGIAKALADTQERWARQQGYDSVTFKTRNRFKAMLSFSLNNGFFIIDLEPKPDPMETRIWLKKML